MKFIQGFHKTADAASAGKSALESAGKVLKGAKEMGGGAWEGLKKSMGGSVGRALAGKELKHLPAAAKAHGGYLNSLKTPKGRQAMGTAIGRAAPSLAAGGAYAVGAKKVYDKTLGSDNPNAVANAGYY